MSSDNYQKCDSCGKMSVKTYLHGVVYKCECGSSWTVKQYSFCKCGSNVVVRSPKGEGFVCVNCGDPERVPEKIYIS